MTNPSVLQRLYYPHGPLVDEALKRRLKLHRERFRLVVTVLATSVVHITVFFAVAWLLRYFDVETRLGNIALAIVAAIIFISMAASILPSLVGHWRSESGIMPSGTRRRFRVQKLPQTPPLNAEFLFYFFLPPNASDALVGDLEERYMLVRKKFGARRANFWYWVQVLTSVRPIVWAATKKALKSVLGIAALVEMWRRIRS